MIPVLVVGGAGYIGAHTCKALFHAGYQPVAFDNLSTGHRSFVRWGPLVEGDIHDVSAVADAALSHRVVAAIHFAAWAYVGESVVDPARYYLNNVAGTLNLLQGLRKAGCDKLVFSSTCAVYGEPDQVPIDETTRPQPVNPYGRSKLMVEQILNDYRSAYDLKSVVLRYFNACGADHEGELGELRAIETHLIPRALMALQGHIDDFKVFGSDFPTPDGTAIRDYIHVSDLADAHVAALALLLNGHAGHTLNLGTGRGYSVKEVLDTIAAHTGQHLANISGSRRAGDPAILVAKTNLAREILGFQPTRSALDNIIQTAWAWHRVAHPKIDRQTS